MKSKISGIDCLLELNGLTKEFIEDHLIKPQIKYSANQSIEFLAKSFIGTPSFYESSLKNLPKDSMRVRFCSFDCVTFIYTLLALCNINTFSEFADKLYTIRYVTNKNKLVDNHEITGNFFHFVCDSLLINAVRRQYIKNITHHVIDKEHLTKICVFLKAFRRDKKFDSDSILIKPEFGERFVTEEFIKSDQIDKIKLDQVNSGDLILFTRGEHLLNGTKPNVLIGHLAIVMKEKNKLYLIHVTRNSYWKPDATLENPQKMSTGIYYENDPRKEQIGVGYATQPMDIKDPLLMGDEKIFFYSPEEKYELRNYAMAYFAGISVWRPL